MNIIREYHKPTGLTEDELKGFIQASEALARDYPISKEDILTHIATIANDLKRAKERTDLRRDGENNLIELTKIQKFINALTPDNEKDVEIILKFPSNNAEDDVHIKSEYIIMKTLNILRGMADPEIKKRKKGGQEGKALYKQILIEHKQSLYKLYRKDFKSDNKLYLYIIDILSEAGYKAKGKKVKLSLSTIKSLPIIKTVRTNK